MYIEERNKSWPELSNLWMSSRGRHLFFPMKQPPYWRIAWGKYKSALATLAPHASACVTWFSLTNPPCPAILTLIKLTFTVATSAVCFENNRNVARNYPSRISWQGSFFILSWANTTFALYRLLHNLPNLLRNLRVRIIFWFRYVCGTLQNWPYPPLAV
jgi:hypothetical protein